MRNISPAFVLNVGDSFYTDGIRNTTDGRWNTTFEHVFAKGSEKWYSVLGNHDWYGNEIFQDDRGTYAQVEYTHSNPYHRWCMPDYNYTLTVRASGFTMKIIFIDTQSMLVDTEGGCRDKANPAKVSRREKCCRGVSPNPFAEQLQWLANQACSSTADWTVVVGHIPLVTAGSRIQGFDKGVTEGWVEHVEASEDVKALLRRKFIYRPSYKDEVMLEAIGPTLQRCNVDVYLSGHEHMTQHYTWGDMALLGYGDSGKDNLIDYIEKEPSATACRLTGQCFASDAAVKAAWGRDFDLLFKDLGGAFGDIRFTKTEMKVATVSGNGTVIHRMVHRRKGSSPEHEAAPRPPAIHLPIFLGVLGAIWAVV
eukprot:Sspe_Gene.94981::Locus_67312_Transcript_1_1_Confidence_1.000_Length_1636::g.94981::m.94981/K14379/ACP5; tartrate-resistant acid phosphatase type 5